MPKSENFENKYTVDHVMYVVLNFPCSYRNLQWHTDLILVFLPWKGSVKPYFPKLRQRNQSKDGNTKLLMNNFSEAVSRRTS